MDAEVKQTQTRPFTPEELASFVIVFRQALGWTQETLEEISGLNVRTIQRVERAEPSSVDTRRALARAFDLEDIDVFNKPHTFKSEEQIRKEAEEFQRKNVTLDRSFHCLMSASI
jgi:transcriptional regulator with XRE-family HTH domain